jgi:CSLREA domain-containing protein
MRLLLAGFLTLVLAAPAAAADITVTTRLDTVTNDGRCSLREAVTAANTNAATGGCPAGAVAMDVILLAEGHHVLARTGAGEDNNVTGDLDLVDFGPVTLRGVGRDRTVVSAEGLDRVVDVQAGADVRIADLSITGGAAPDGASGAPGPNPGGPGEHGGGIRSAGWLELQDSDVRGNRAGRGGTGGSGVTGGPGGAGGEGGGIYSSSTLTLIRTRVSDNRAGAAGTSGGSSFAGTSANQVGGDGGGVAASGLTTLIDTVIEGNRAGAGGDGGEAAVGGGSGSAGGDGGGIVVTVPASITRSTIAGNSAGAGGRGASGTSNGGNGGPGGSGGGVLATGSLTVTGTLVSGNFGGDGGAGGDGATNAGDGGAGGRGAGLYGPGGAHVEVESSTFVGGAIGPGGPAGVGMFGNAAPAGSGTAVFGGGTVTLARTIASGTCDGGGVVGDGGNLAASISCPGTLTDPRIDASGLPGAGSPAIDAAASCPDTDLAGTARPQGAACDIGAVEVPATAAAVARTGLAFGSVTTGTAVTRTVDVSNPGLPGLPLAFSVTGDSELTLAGHTCGAVLAGGAGCVVTVRFAPTTPGARTGTLLIGGDSLALTGTGVAPAVDPPGGSPQPTAAPCVVPRLKGKTLIAAARSLQNANCKLGKVTRRGRGRKGRVRSFSPKAGTSLPAGTTVRLVLNRRR